MDRSFDEWVQGVPQEIRQDSLWHVQAYRLALYLFELCQEDTVHIRKDANARILLDQLYRATGSISANIAEGFSKSTGKDRARFYEYALGSARESRDWYYKVRYAITEDIYKSRIELLSRIIRLLITMIPQQRTSGSIREDAPPYTTSEDLP